MRFGFENLYIYIYKKKKKKKKKKKWERLASALNIM